MLLDTDNDVDMHSDLRRKSPCRRLVLDLLWNSDGWRKTYPLSKISVKIPNPWPLTQTTIHLNSLTRFNQSNKTYRLLIWKKKRARASLPQPCNSHSISCRQNKMNTYGNGRCASSFIPPIQVFRTHCNSRNSKLHAEHFSYDPCLHLSFFFVCIHTFLCHRLRAVMGGLYYFWVTCRASEPKVKPHKPAPSQPSRAACEPNSEQTPKPRYYAESWHGAISACRIS